MADSSTEERCKLAVQLVEQAPPGEVNDVINDVRTIIGDDQALMPLILPSIRAYNLSQLTAVEHQEADGVPAHYSLLSEAAIVPGEDNERYVDAIGKRSFAFDHASSAASDYQPYALPEEEESFCAELAKSLSAYTKNHFSSGQSSVNCSQFPLLPPEPEQPAQAASQPSEPVPVAQEAASTENEPAPTDAAPQDVTGDIEPLPTPMTGDVKGAIKAHEGEQLEVDQPGGLEKLDEEIKEEQEKEEDQGKVDIPKPVDQSETSATAEDIPTAGPDSESPVATSSNANAEAASPDAAAPADETIAPSQVSEPIRPKKTQQKEENPRYTLEGVGNRYNPSNFWTGRWRTRWVVDQAKGSVDGTILVDVHYYEQGNVQMAAKHSASFPLPQASGSTSVASQIVTTIAKMEAAYQMELNDAYGDLGDKAFRALRRALPVTRQKMDWDKVSGYSLGSDISKARA